MKKNLVIALFLIVTAMMYAGGQSDSGSASWPEKPIQLVVPYNAGGDTDFYGRVYGKYISELLKQPVVITNMGGASGTVGATFVRDAEPDGYTFLINQESMLINAVSGIANFDHSVFETCAALVYDNTYIAAAHVKAPYKTLDDVISAAKSSPGKLIYGSNFGYSTYLGRQFEEKFKVKFNIVDAGGGSERNAALLAQKIDLNINVYGPMKPYIDSGDFHVICTMAETRNPLFPNVPTAKEQGYDWVGGRYYFTLFPKGTDRAIIDKMAAAIKTASENPKLAEETQKAYCVNPGYLGPDDLKKRLDTVIVDFKKNPELLQ
jgi:tripartite-type tricarboxylate transporter receptor subunit TctC